jgi:RHS repeat-associated protein
LRSGCGWLSFDKLRSRLRVRGWNYPFLTSKERDNETSLDYAQAPYFNGLQGRFVSADPLAASAIVSDPQSLNRYTYALNNPLKYVDPTGLDAQNPWGGLDEETRRRLAAKLTSVADPIKVTAKELSAAGTAFNKLVQVTKDGKLDVEATNTKIGTVQNFVDSLGHDSQIWDQVKSITGVNLQGNGRQGDVEFTVSNRNAFENAWVNTKDRNGDYRFTNLTSSDKFRERGYSVDDPSMHISRDSRRIGGGLCALGPNYRIH